MKIIEVVVVVIKYDNKIFIFCCNYGEFENMWEFLGGKIEEGEIREELFICEIKEELELNIEVNKYLIIVEYDYMSFYFIMYCFMCIIIGGELCLNVYNDVKWIILEELDKFNWILVDILVVEKFKECEKKYGYFN